MPNLEKVLMEVKKGKAFFCEKTEISGADMKKKMELIQEYLCKEYGSCEEVKITYDNYKAVIQDIEIRAFFEELYLAEIEKPDYSIKFLFMMAFSSQGYNFGQFRLMSHLLKLGYDRQNVKIFPMFLKGGGYEYNQSDLEKLLCEYQPTYVCETGYVGWELEILKLNKFIKAHSNALIMTGGPFTSSHFEFCKKKLGTDIIFFGHGEYVFEAFLKSCRKESSLLPDINRIPGVIYANSELEHIDLTKNGIVNKYMDFLYWDYDLLYELYQIAPVINLFTSEECKGNCIFCYRQSYLKNNTMSNPELLKRLSVIVNLPCFHKIDKTVFIRFFDDDFFASEQRDVSFIKELSDVLSAKVRIFELTFSIRSVNRLGRLYDDTVYQALKELNLKRVTIGVDGFNNNDLKRLRKGYHIDCVFDVIKKFSVNNIPVLMYAILTTFETDYKDLFESLLNMLKLAVHKGVYIGPTITPCICVHSGNKKLYPQFQGEDSIYLNADTVDDSDNNEIKIMSAQILPKDLFVRRYLTVISAPTEMESAYILPLMCKYMEELAIASNILYRLIHKEGYRQKMSKVLQKLKQRYTSQLKNKHLWKNDRIQNLNKENKIQRKIRDVEYYIGMLEDDDRICTEYNNMKEIFYQYRDFCMKQNRNNSDSSLAGGIMRLSSLPVRSFLNKSDCDFIKAEPCRELTADIKITEEEYHIFERLKIFQ